ncbi:AMP-binding protein [Rhodococcoides fascians]|uniref:AMP-binding protein n=1 Tax=Rhodococcoides fascians TaxID=1828 RepID=UPI0009B9078C
MGALDGSPASPGGFYSVLRGSAGRRRSFRSLTWAEPVTQAERAARAVTSLVASGKRVPIIACNSVDCSVAQFACALAGTPLVPIDPGATDHGCRHIFTQSHARLILVEAHETATCRCGAGSTVSLPAQHLI